MIATNKSTIYLFMLISMLLYRSIAMASDELRLDYHVALTAQTSSQSLAPYMMGSWNEGRYVAGSGIWQEAGLHKGLDMTKRFSWSAGIDYLAGLGEKTAYDRWDAASESWTTHKVGLPSLRLTQLYARVKYRAVYVTLGLKRTHSGIVDDDLSSGDLTRSNNAAPIPGIQGGFVDFQDIPLTNGWLQIDGEVMYGKLPDSRFKEKEFNRYSGIEALDVWYNYKRCYFRTNPAKNFHVTFGMQAAGMFGGYANIYRKGKTVRTMVRGFRWRDVLQMLFPLEGGENYYTGNHVGSWDLKGVYKLRDGSRISAYFQFPWEDGSGIGKKNGWDGLWGVQYDFARRGIVTKALVEYLDFTNQSGPMHFDPEDLPENPLSGVSQGADSYYNNDYYGGYTNYGMSIGTPFLVSPIYNRNGALDYLHNRGRGFHAAVEGNPSDRFSYKVMVGYEIAGGSGRVPDYRKSHNTSALMEGRLQPSSKLPGLELSMKVAFDTGTLRGDNFGAQLQIAYRGDFNVKRSSK